MEVTSKHIGKFPIRKVSAGKKLFDHDLEVYVARSVQEAESLREVWEALQASPPADIDYLLTSVKYCQGVIRPYVIVVCRHGKPETMLVGIIKNIEKETKLKNRVVLRRKTRILEVVLGGVIGNTSRDNCAALIFEVKKSLKRREADAVYFQEIPTESNIYKLSQKVPCYFFRDHCAHEENHYRLTLPPSLDAFYSRLNTKKRHSLRSTVKRLGKKFSNKLAVKCFRSVADIDQFCQEAEAISQKSWQGDIEKGFANDIETRKLLTVWAEKNKFLGFILYLEKRACAFSYGYVHQNTFFGEYTGYDLRYRHHGVGTVLMINAIEAACNDPYLENFDFGWMGSKYKAHYCDQVWKEVNFYIFQPTFKGAAMNAFKVLSIKLPELKKKWQYGKDK